MARRDSNATITHCPYCALNCGMLLKADGATVEGQTRWKGSPLTKGALCSKGATAFQQVNHVDRLTMPLLRKGNGFVEIEWDDALDRAADGFLKIREHHGAAANAVLSGGSLTNEKAYLMGKLARLALGTPHIDYNGRFCMAAAGAANTKAFGADRMMSPLAELDRAQVVVVVGANISAAFPVAIPQALERLRKRGGRVIVIDPRAARFVKPGDLHLAPEPGTDGIVFSGLLRQINELGLVDHKFIRNRTTGFEDALAAAGQWDPASVHRFADVPVDSLMEAAALIGNADRCMYLHGRGPEQQLNGTDNVLSIINVGLACGHVGRPGCGINMLTGQRNGQGGREWGQRCNQLPAGRDITNPADRAVVAERWGVDPAVLPGAGKSYVEILQMAGRGEVKGLLSICTNMNVSSPDLLRVDEQMAALEHVVMIDPFFSRSAQHANIVLPGSTFAEEEGTVTTIEGRVVRVDQVVPPVAKRADIDVIRNLARRLGAAEHFNFFSGAEVFEEMRAVSADGPNDYAGISWDRIRDEGGLFWPCPDERHPGTPQLYTERFHHPDGLARFHAVDPQQPGPPATSDYPLVLTTGRVLAQFLSGNQTMRIAAQNKLAPGPFVEIHPDTAVAYGLQAESVVEVSSRQGSVQVPWVANDRLRHDTMFMPYHWAECNTLVAADLDPTSKIPGFKYTPVRVSVLTDNPSLPVADVAGIVGSRP